MNLDLTARIADGVGETPLRALPWVDEAPGECRCDLTFREPVGTGVEDRAVLGVDADDCPGRGDLAASADCLATVVEALSDRDVDVIRTRHRGRERSYADTAADLLVAAGRFRERIEFHEERLADRVTRDPLGAAREASGRAGAAKRIATETGLLSASEEITGRTVESDKDPDVEETLRAHVGPTAATARVAAAPPPSAALVDRWTVPTGATVRLYEGDDSLRTYHLTPPTADMDADSVATLAAARERLLDDPAGGDRAPGRAVRAAADPGDPVADLTEVLRRHTHGYGAFEHVFADDRVSDATVTAPVGENPLRVVLDGERCRTNVRLPPEGAATLASRLRRSSGRAFSRATPTLDATIESETGRVRVAAATAPASDGLSFTFRRGDPEAWTLARLVSVDTLTPAAAGLLSVAVERGVTGLIAGGRAAGKTTALGSLLWELPAQTRAIAIEDTPELPVDALADAGRDVQRLRVGDGAELAPADAVRTALRMGGGAISVGEVRGEEAEALYEAMRVGAAGETVLGTIHGEDPAAVEERVVTDLGVARSSFAATDLIAVLDSHRVESIVEVGDHDGGVSFDPLFERTERGLVGTGRIDRGESRLIDGLAEPDESYAAVREAVHRRSDRIREAVRAGRIAPRRYAGGNESGDGSGGPARGER
ncbi:type IV secretory pathway ATPase VirB11/archaellum biosynthesis ATPase [Halorubrum trapanicum]|uniref:Type IV secretory pathway ATPase VirB11/archaellum biosynthesis ATPase n=1 Tax=Halorubrum trapanicum TaxID=29284 RepID=A0A8J7RU16_9EURY|nr:ATPase, T2SS/T4P/T4SS family [Halorubrum trapanicum]MBP1901687.1 type IV secretory pathway ATPase VirB11/archaellum biosynthesis ATPase [Halorubrum trapanicum]